MERKFHIIPGNPTSDNNRQSNVSIHFPSEPNPYQYIQHTRDRPSPTDDVFWSGTSPVLSVTIWYNLPYSTKSWNILHSLTDLGLYIPVTDYPTSRQFSTFLVLTCKHHSSTLCLHIPTCISHFCEYRKCLQVASLLVKPSLRISTWSTG